MSFEKQFTSDNWHREALNLTKRNAIRTRRWGMRVTVYGDSTPANNGDYVLTYNQASTNRQDNSNWVKVADIGATWGGGGGSYTFTNGLYDNAGSVELGTSLITKDTALLWDGAVKRDFKIGANDSSAFINVVGGTGQLYLYSDFLTYISGGTGAALSLGLGTSGDYAQLSSPTFSELLTTNYGFSLSEEISAPGILLTDNAAGRGIRYNADYSSTLVDLSLPPVIYVKSTIGGNPVDSLVINPTITQDGYAIKWNNTNGEYELAPSGGGVSFGTSGQIPYMNVGGTDFDYLNGFSFDSTLGYLNIGNNSSLVIPRIQATSSGANINLELYGKGTGYIWANNAVRTGSSINIYTHINGTSITSYDTSTTSDFTILADGTDSVDINGRRIVLNAGNAYTVSGDGNGGDVLLKTGLRRTAGTGLDGKIIFDALAGWVEMTNTSGTVTVTADRAAMYVKDIAAGNAAFHFKTENAQEIKLYQVNAGSAYAITNVTTDRAYDANSTTIDEIADVLGTLIADLKLTGLIA